MTDYDYIASVQKIVAMLRQENLEHEAEKVSECVNFSSTGGEIVMCCRYNFSEFLREKKITNKLLLQEINQYLDRTK